MVDELKIIAEIMGGVTEGALTGVIAYMVMVFFKALIWPVGLYFTIKAVLTGFTMEVKSDSQ